MLIHTRVVESSIADYLDSLDMLAVDIQYFCWMCCSVVVAAAAAGGGVAYLASIWR